VKWMYYTEFGINLKNWFALWALGGGYMHCGWSFLSFVVQLVTFCSPDIIPYDCRLFYLDSKGHLSGMVVMVCMWGNVLMGQQASFQLCSSGFRGLL